MGAEVARWLIALGAVAAWTGIIVAGMGMSELVAGSESISRGLVVTVVGLLALVIGIVAYRGTLKADETGLGDETHARHG